MIEAVTQGAAALYLIWIACDIVPNDNMRSKIIYRAVPVSIGFVLLCHTYARIMGWQP